MTEGIGPANPPPFIPGLVLCGAFYAEAVRPILDDAFPGLVHSAALIGPGSEVLGFDDAMSTDHHWGPRLQLFLGEDTPSGLAEAIHTTLAQRLPTTFRGYSTHFSPPNPDDNGTQLLQPITRDPINPRPINHRVTVSTPSAFFQDYLGVDITNDLDPADWLTLPQQKLRTLTEGAVFHDGVGLDHVRARLAWYPHDLWLYLLAAGWARIGQEEHLMGRAGWAGDELGAGLLGSRLVRDIMRLVFLMERRYAPYPKWFGTAFSRLDNGRGLTPHLLAVQTSATWQERQAHLVPAYEILADMHNRLGLTDPLPTRTVPFFGRPFQVIAQHGFADALLAQIADPTVARLAQQQPIGNIDLISDNTDLLEGTNWRPALRRLWT